MKSTVVTVILILLGLTASAYAAGERPSCQHCRGTGKNPTDNLSGGVPTFGNDQGTTHCSICSRTVPKPHVHGPCLVCHGTGETR
ncbi:MAG TPA: hypothetical protein VIO38_06460 [Rariglobus sp.]